MKIDFIDGSKRAIALEDETCNLSPYDLYGTVTIFKGFIWDGASLPNFSMSLVCLHPWHPAVRRAGKWHDFAYKRGWDRKKADKMFRMMTVEDGANILQGWVMYLGLRIGGWKAYRKYRKSDK